MVVLVIAAPMLIAYLIFTTGIGMPMGTINKGDLILPATSISELSLADYQGKEVDWLQSAKENQKWRLVMVGEMATVMNSAKSNFISRAKFTSVWVIKQISKAPVSGNHHRNKTCLRRAYRQPNTQGIKLGFINSTQWQSAFADTSVTQPLSEESVFVVDQQGLL